MSLTCRSMSCASGKHVFRKSNRSSEAVDVAITVQTTCNCYAAFAFSFTMKASPSKVCKKFSKRMARAMSSILVKPAFSKIAQPTDSPVAENGAPVPQIAAPEASDGGAKIDTYSRARLNEALHELLECKRILDKATEEPLN